MGKVIILGTAHLKTTPGKHSIDKRLYEYKYSREIVNMVEKDLKALGYTVYVDYKPEEPNAQMKGATWKQEQSNELKWRVAFVNNLCAKYGAKNCVYVSIHVNAAGGDGKWHNARGFSVFVSRNCSEASKKLAQTFTINASKDPKIKGNRSVPSAKYWSADYYVLKYTKCPAVLTENLFQDNEEDVNFLLSNEGKEAIKKLHIDSIKSIV